MENGSTKIYGIIRGKLCELSEPFKHMRMMSIKCSLYISIYLYSPEMSSNQIGETSEGEIWVCRGFKFIF